MSKTISKNTSHAIVYGVLAMVIVTLVIVLVRKIESPTKGVDINTREVLASDECAKHGYSKVRLLQDGGIVCTKPTLNMEYIPREGRTP